LSSNLVVTNSLASTDGKAAFSGYQTSRRALLRAGVELYELKPKAGEERLRIRWASPGSLRAGLHAKTFSFDRRTLFVGSFSVCAAPRRPLFNRARSME
jgi:putative cardiolipin synthase